MRLRVPMFETQQFLAIGTIEVVDCEYPALALAAVILLALHLHHSSLISMLHTWMNLLLSIVIIAELNQIGATFLLHFLQS